MKAFISYSHQDTAMLDILHKHLAQLKRDNVISTWTDQQITPGGNLTNSINRALSTSNIFLALLSPDYIASQYCYEKEFETALEMEKNGQIVIVPIIVEPCDWLSTPFQAFKALPKDGKAVSIWDNKNTAFLDVIQNIRVLTNSSFEKFSSKPKSDITEVQLSRNYRIKKDFDSIEKIEFADKSFIEVKEYLKRYLEEIENLNNIKFKIVSDTSKGFECILVNRNKIGAESTLSLSTSAQQSFGMQQNEKQINFSISKQDRPSQKGFSLSFDDYHLFWSVNNPYSFSTPSQALSIQDIANIIWDDLLESVGIG